MHVYKIIPLYRSTDAFKNGEFYSVLKLPEWLISSYDYLYIHCWLLDSLILPEYRREFNFDEFIQTTINGNGLNNVFEYTRCHMGTICTTFIVCSLKYDLVMWLTSYT